VEGSAAAVAAVRVGTRAEEAQSTAVIDLRGGQGWRSRADAMGLRRPR
jgi:hypothetical protein